MMRLNKLYLILLATGISLLLYSCDSSDLISEESPTITSNALDLQKAKKGGDDDVLINEDLLNNINVALSSEDVNYKIAIAEFITIGENGKMGNEVIAKDVGNKQLGFDFVPNDSRRGWSGPVGGSTDNITYAIDQTTDAVPVFGGLTGAETTSAILRAMTTWDNITCSDLELSQNDDFGIDIGVIAFLNGFGGSPFVFADVQHAGWRDINFGGGVLGVAFTFGLTDPVTGEFTDIDENGKLDTAFREIYYDPSFNWADDGSSNVDVETVALHEAGHGLSQAHFGKVMIKKNGDLKASPRAVMNALYAGPLRDLQGTDNGGHCSNWGEWPSN